MAAATQHHPAQGPGHVLYIDHANHLTPLTLAYHATASRHLTSGRSDVIPPSTTVEVDSVYCPQCLAYEAASATSGVCHKEHGGCKSCPICFSPLSISIDETTASESESNNSRLICHYICGYCRWSSRECGVTSNADKLLEHASTSDEIEEKQKHKQRGLAIVEISKQLDLCLQQQISERNKVGDALFDSITKMWAQREEEEKQKHRMKIGISISINRDVDNRGSNWSLEILEQTLMQKKNALNSSNTDRVVETGREDIKPRHANVTSSNQLPTPQQMAAQMTITTTTPQSRSDLLPLPVNYRARVSRRCRAELAAGRTGILMKPKQNPLDGDTSLRSGHGQWWMKDSSAVHVVPNVQLQRVGADVTRHKYAALLKVKNPTLNMIRLRLVGPSCCELIDQTELQNVLVNPFTETFVRGRHCSPDATASIAPTEFIVLHPADDPFLDIRKDRSGDPLDVKDWDAMKALSSGNWDKSQFRIVATEGDTAWVEVLLCNATPVTNALSESDYLAVPFALQIEVGNGSWEASLIKRQDLPEEESDLVTLNLVALMG
ncbi:hypothetical protein ACHAXH_002128 [Discostella pseudostelligera]